MHTNVVVSIIVDEALGQSLAVKRIISDNRARQSEGCKSN
jgi:hypothetical protein